MNLATVRVTPMSGRRPNRRAHRLAAWQQAYVVSIGLVVAAGFTQSESMVAAAVTLCAAVYVGRDLRVRRQATVMTAYAVGAGLSFGFANWLGYLLDDSRYRAVFDDYLVREYTNRGQLLAAAGLVVPLLAFERCRSSPLVRAVPRVGGPSPDRLLVVLAFGLAAVAWLHRIRPLPRVARHHGSVRAHGGDGRGLHPAPPDVRLRPTSVAPLPRPGLPRPHVRRGDLPRPLQPPSHRDGVAGDRLRPSGAVAPRRSVPACSWLR